MKTPIQAAATYPQADDPEHAAYFLVGPTATGKSAVAHSLALADGLDVLSADSMLVYRGMDVGTAKPTMEERAEVRYRGIDLVDPEQSFSVAAFLTEAASAFAAARQRARPLMVVGGTGLYVKALINGLDPDAPPDTALRTALTELFRKQGVAGLQEELERRAPGYLSTMADPRNPRRLMRALERASTGTLRAAPDDRASLPSLVGLMMPRDALESRIRQRVDEMYARGLLEEAEQLRSGAGPLSETAREAIGYREAFEVLDGRMTTEEARERTAVRTRRLAKRQMTWFRNQANVTWIEIEPSNTAADIARRVRMAWREAGPNKVGFNRGTGN